MNDSAKSDLLVWIDCEMTGLRLDTDALIEVAAIVTDGELNVLDEGIDIVIHTSDEKLAGMPEVVVKMHANSGLTDEVRASSRSSTPSGSTSAPSSSGRADEASARRRPRARSRSRR